MAEHWISALKAISLAGSSVALCTRAHAGLVKASAQLILVDGQPHENHIIPPFFWWADGHAALQQDWNTGDFSTWIEDKSILVEAFGVMFALRGVLDILPVEKRAQTTRRLSVAGAAEWFSASDAVRYAIDSAGCDPSVVSTGIIEQARLGFVDARAVEMTPLDIDGNPDLSREGAREWDVPPEFWNACAPEQDWTRGTFQGTSNIGGEEHLIRLNGVHFGREALTLVLPARPALVQVDASAKNVGGRPPAAFSDDLMCAVWGRIYRGDLRPDKQATIKNALLDWASNNGHSLGETTAKDKARKIFDACRLEDEKS